MEIYKKEIKKNMVSFQVNAIYLRCENSQAKQ